MNILFLTIGLPDLNKSSSMYGDLVKEFKRQKYNIFVVAPILESDTNKKTHLSIEDGVNVLRVKTKKIFGVSNIKKGLAFQFLVINYILAIRKHWSKVNFNFAYSHTPPPELAILVSYIKKQYKCPFYLILRDFTWQDAVGFGYFKRNSLICRYYYYLDKLLYNKSDSIGCMSQGNIDFVLKHYPYVNNDKLHILHNFQTEVKYDIQDCSIKSEFNVDDKFVVVYGGNTSIAQKIDHLLNLAESCLDFKDIVFLLLGKGSYFHRIQQEAKERKLSNIVFHNLVPRDKYLKLLKSCDVGLIVLNEELSSPNIPSKSMSYFNASLPILASIDYVTDYGVFLDNINAGLWSYSGDNDKLKENLLALYTNKEERIKKGTSGYNFYINNMLPIHAYSIIMSHIKSK